MMIFGSTVRKEDIGMHFKRFAQRNALLIFLLIIISIIAFTEKSFFTATNALTMLRQVAVAGIMVCGTCFVLVSGTIDLSIGGNLTLSLCACAILAPQIGYFWAMIVCIVIATACSTLNGLLVSRVVKNDGTPFIITFGTKTIMYAAALLITKGHYQKFEGVPAFDWFGKGMVGIVPVPVLILFIVIIACHFVFSKLRIGRRLYFIGINPESARMSGVSIVKYRVLSYAIQGVCIGLAALIQGARVGSATASSGLTYDFDVLTMAIVGGVTLGGGYGSILGATVGIIVIGVLSNAMNLMDISTNPQSIVKGIIILIAVWLDTYNKKKEMESAI
jgi:ribose/xylose/arabinose/galactoside ABC-type transport system permease subunit